MIRYLIFSKTSYTKIEKMWMLRLSSYISKYSTLHKEHSGSVARLLDLGL